MCKFGYVSIKQLLGTCTMSRQLLAMAGRAVAAIGPLARDRRGAFAAMTAVIAPVMIGMTALSVDLGVWYLESNRLQTAADAAAVGAAYLLRSGSASAPYQAAALAEANNATGNGYLIGTLQTPARHRIVRPDGRDRHLDQQG